MREIFDQQTLKILEPLELKGIANKVPAYKPLGVKKADGPKKAKNSMQSREEVRRTRVRVNIAYQSCHYRSTRCCSS